MNLHPAERLALAAAERRDAALAADPVRRRAGGVVHTPPELARYVLASVDALARSQFGLEQGVLDPRALLVDPACGPGAFLAAAAQLWQARGRPPGARLCGIELDPQALASARELAPHAPPALRLIEADTLREPVLQERLPPLAASDVLVIAGNPPWTVARAEPTSAMQHLLEDFRRDAHGQRLAERKLGVLSDAYVRFVRVCAEAVRAHPGGGLIGLITNASFLDGPVHRGMRAALLRWFDSVHVVDLGGSALLARASAASESARDDNVFGVRPSVAITFLCRAPGGAAAPRGEFGYARLWGTRAEKLARLERALPVTTLAPSRPEPPFYRFASPGNAPREYASWPALSDAMPFHREGVQTNRDRAAVDSDRDRLLSRLRAFVRAESDPLLEQANRDSHHYSVRAARRAVAAALERDPDGSLGISVRPLAYRPYDRRWFCPVAPLCHRPRPELLAAIDRSPSVLIGVRKDRGSVPYAHYGAADCAIDNCFLSTRSSCRARAFPARTPDGADNLAPELRDACEQVASRAVSAEDFQHYALAFLASTRFRERFDAALKTDYPRIPRPRERAHWDELVRCGRELAVRLGGAREAPSLEAEGEEGVASAEAPASTTLRIGHHQPFGHASASLLGAASRAHLLDLTRRTRHLDLLLERFAYVP